MQERELYILNRDQVQPGDVVLVYDPTLSEKVKEATGLSYSHAGMCVETCVIADVSRSGVKKRPLNYLLEMYSHAVVLRQPDCWDASRIAHLRQLVDEAIQNKTQFNIDGIRQFESSRQQHEQE